MAVNRCICGCKHISECGYSVRKQRLLNRVNSLCTVVVFCAVLLCHVEPTIGDDTTECSAVRMGFQTRGINASDLLAEPKNG